MSKICVWAMIASFFAVLVSCGDEDATASTNQNENMAIAAVESLPECDDYNTEKLFFVTDSAAVFFCANGDWRRLNSSSTGQKDTLIINLRDSAFIKDTLFYYDTLVLHDSQTIKDSLIVRDTLVLTHVDTLVVKDSLVIRDTTVFSHVDTLVVKDSLVIRDTTVLSHVDTLVVKDSLVIRDTTVLSHVDTLVLKDTLVVLDTLVGLNGTSCIAEAIANGYKILCGGDSIGVVMNGKNSTGDCMVTRNGSNVIFTCGDSEVSIDLTQNEFNPYIQYDEPVYYDGGFGVSNIPAGYLKTVKIGNQIWTAENLGTQSNGTVYIYGRWMPWAPAMDSSGCNGTSGKGCGMGVSCTPTYPVRGACPEGWHLPTKGEWQELLDYVGGINALKSKTWNGAEGTDLYGFNMLGATGNYTDAYYSSKYGGLQGWTPGSSTVNDDFTIFWTSTPVTSCPKCKSDAVVNKSYSYALQVYRDSSIAPIFRESSRWSYCYVRCVKD